jgi:predicted enzyme related to lactoylglutathione lyase
MPDMNLAIVCSPDPSQAVGLLLEPNQHPASRAYQEAIYQEGLPCIVFSSDDIHADYERLKGKGVLFRQAPEANEIGFQAMFEDGFGNIIQLVQLT